jgi:hypothetical protein
MAPYRRGFVLTSAVISFFFVLTFGAPAAKTATFKGRVFRSDTGQPIPNAVLILLDQEKTDTEDKSVDTKTDSSGQFVFENVIPGRYTISIRAWYDNENDAPCQLLAGKLKEKGSVAVLMRDGERYVVQVFVEGFKVKAKKTITKDFDLVCLSAFAD